LVVYVELFQLCGFDFVWRKNPMDLSVSQEATIHVKPVDRRGNPSNLPLDAPPAYVASNPLLLNVQPAADGLSALLVPTGETGAVDVTITASYKGTALTPAVEHVNLTAGIPVGFVITEDAPVDQP
jgi:hypothetical protein